MNRLHRLIALLLALALVAAACGGGDDEPELAEETATAVPEEADDEVEAAEEDDPDFTLGDIQGPDGPVAPLTGLGIDDPDLLDRPAITMKIDNHPNARPQAGINQVDVMVEEQVEGISRLVAVVHSEDIEQLGPVRSARSSDPDIVDNFNRPIFGNSGGNTFVLGQVSLAEQTGKLYSLNVNNVQNPQTDYFRDSSGGRFAPHNLFTSTEALWSQAPDDLEPPAPLWGYRDGADLPSDAREVGGLRVVWRDNYVVDYAWDAEVEGFRRWQQGTPQVDTEGEQAAPENVIVLFTEYVTSAADALSPEAVTRGSGRALFFTDGHAIAGTWTRGDAVGDVWILEDDNGDPIELTRGQTWIALAEIGRVTELSPDDVADLVDS